MWVASVLAAVLLVMAPSLGRAPAAQASVLGTQGLPSAEVEQIKSTIQDWGTAVSNGDYDTWATLWAPDGVLVMPGHARVVGRDKVVDAARSHFRLVSSFTFADWAVTGREDLAVTMVTVTLHTAVRNVSGNVMLVLRNNGADQWLVQAVIFDRAPHGS